MASKNLLLFKFSNKFYAYTNNEWINPSINLIKPLSCINWSMRMHLEIQQKSAWKSLWLFESKLFCFDVASNQPKVWLF